MYDASANDSVAREPDQSTDVAASDEVLSTERPLLQPQRAALRSNPAQVKRHSLYSTPFSWIRPSPTNKVVSLAELLDAIFGTPGEREVMSERLNEYLGEIPMQDLTKAQDRLTWQAEDALNAVVMKQLGRFDEWEGALVELTSQVRSWKNSAKAKAVRQALDEEADDG